MLMSMQVADPPRPWGMMRQQLGQILPRKLLKFEVNPYLLKLKLRKQNGTNALKRRNYYEHIMHAKRYKGDNVGVAYNAYQGMSHQQAVHDKMTTYFKSLNAPALSHQHNFEHRLEQDLYENHTFKRSLPEELSFKNIHSEKCDCRNFKNGIEHQNRKFFQHISTTSLPELVPIPCEFEDFERKERESYVTRMIQNNSLKMMRIKSKVKGGHFGVLDSLASFREKLRRDKRIRSFCFGKQEREHRFVCNKSECPYPSQPSTNLPISSDSSLTTSVSLPSSLISSSPLPTLSSKSAASSPLSSLPSPPSSHPPSSSSSSPVSFYHDQDSKVPLKKRKGKLLKETNKNEGSTVNENEFGHVILDEVLTSQLNHGNGDSSLHEAIRTNDAALAETLIREMNKQNFTLDIYNRHKQTPLHLCIHLNNAKILQFLLNGGASCNVPNLERNSAVHLAIKMKNLSALSLISILSQVLIDETATDKNDKSIFDLAAEQGIPTQLLQHFLSINTSNMMEKLHKFERFTDDTHF